MAHLDHLPYAARLMEWAARYSDPALHADHPKVQGVYRHLIKSGKGSMSVSQLAQATGVRKSVVKEALYVLEGEGVVEVYQLKGESRGTAARVVA